uniref:Uncharacterized protein n=1 Tax=Glossina palpalis gambiensis TaxID=67801 RepID=A0A1B0AM50_9MUSC
MDSNKTELALKILQVLYRLRWNKKEQQESLDTKFASNKVFCEIIVIDQVISHIYVFFKDIYLRTHIKVNARYN